MIAFANAIYDVVFKYLMEDERSARIIISALLQRKVTRVEMRNHEYSNRTKSDLSLYRVDFSAHIINAQGEEETILIELQKRWLRSEVLRFRRYLGAQYMDFRTISQEPGNQGFGYPCVAIYILGHTLDDVEEPIVYIKRKLTDQNDNPIEGADKRHKFIDSVTHDGIIVQLPRLRGKMRTHLERIMGIFRPDTSHIIEIDDSITEKDQDLGTVVTRLKSVLAEPDIRRDMEVEEEILSDLVEVQEELQDAKNNLKATSAQLEQTSVQLEQTSVQLEQTSVQLEQTSVQLEQTSVQLEQTSVQLEQKSAQLEQKDAQLAKQFDALRNFAKFLLSSGSSVEMVVQQTTLPVAEVEEMKRELSLGNENKT